MKYMLDHKDDKHKTAFQTPEQRENNKRLDGTEGGKKEEGLKAHHQVMYNRHFLIWCSDKRREASRLWQDSRQAHTVRCGG